MKRLKTAIIGLSACSGCQVQFLNLEDSLLDLLEVLDFVNFPLAKAENSRGPFDLALVEGSVTTPKQAEELKELRKKTTKLIALGTCACFGGVQALNNFRPLEEAKQKVYGGAKLNYKSTEVHPISDVVKIDGMAPGCPFNKSHFLEIVKSLVLGKKLPVVDYNVCAECKLKENNCLLDQGKCCLGPVVMGGCGAICPTHGYTCEGCRGPSEDAKVDTLDAFMKIVEDRKIPKDEAIKKLRKYAGAVDPFRGKKK